MLEMFVRWKKVKPHFDEMGIIPNNGGQYLPTLYLKTFGPSLRFQFCVHVS